MRHPQARDPGRQLSRYPRYDLRVRI